MLDETNLPKLIHNASIIYNTELTLKHKKKHKGIKERLDDGTATMKDCKVILKIVWNYKQIRLKKILEEE